jgi:hypothetical protein
VKYFARLDGSDVLPDASSRPHGAYQKQKLGDEDGAGSRSMTCLSSAWE